MKLVSLFLILSIMVGNSRPSQEELWKTATVKTSKQSEVRWIVRKIERSKDRYIALSKLTSTRWEAIAALHNMECGLRFDQNLCNGDPLTKRTWQVPRGRPTTGTPPFTFEFAAIDALKYDKMDKVQWGDLNKSLDALEGYNGWGYRSHGIPSVYLYGGTYSERPGKYIRDGVWSSTAISDQIGVVPILKELGVTWK